MILNVNRKELKYHISTQEASLVSSRLSALMNLDRHSKGASYFIRSLYFDNCFSSSYYEKIEGLENRTKYRLRLYDFDSKTIKFEIKQKKGDTIIKQTARIQLDDLDQIKLGDYECLLSYNHPVLRKIYWAFKRSYFRPQVLIDYERTAFFLDYNNIRVTLDSQVRKSNEIEQLTNPCVTMVPILERNHVIMEIKYNDFFPRWLASALASSKMTRCASSKYCLSRMI